MTELSPRARAACAALRSDGALDDERERVRARLSALGVAMGVGMGTAVATSTASAAASAGATIAGASPTSLPAAAITNVAGTAAGFGSGAAASTKGALISVATVGKLASVPAAVKAALAVLAVSSALVAPKLFQPATESPAANGTRDTGVQTLAHRKPAARAVRELETTNAARVTPLARPVPARAHERTSALPTHSRKPSASVAQPLQESTLAKESALLASALSALRSGQNERARELLTRHEETYGSHALLARERERMRQELSHLLR